MNKNSGAFLQLLHFTNLNSFSFDRGPGRIELTEFVCCHPATSSDYSCALHWCLTRHPIVVVSINKIILSWANSKCHLVTPINPNEIRLCLLCLTHNT